MSGAAPAPTDAENDRSGQRCQGIDVETIEQVGAVAVSRRLGVKFGDRAKGASTSAGPSARSPAYRLG